MPGHINVLLAEAEMSYGQVFEMDDITSEFGQADDHPQQEVMASGYAGLDNELFCLDKTLMVFGDTKKGIEEMVKGVD